MSFFIAKNTYGITHLTLTSDWLALLDTFTLLDSNCHAVALVMSDFSSCSFVDKHTNLFSLSSAPPLLLWRSLIHQNTLKSASALV